MLVPTCRPLQRSTSEAGREEKANSLSGYPISAAILESSNILIMYFLNTGRGYPKKDTATSEDFYKVTEFLDRISSWDKILLEDIRLKMLEFLHA